MPAPLALQHEMHLQMLRLGNRVAAGLIVVAAIGVNLVMTPDPLLAAACLVLAGSLLLLAHLARPGRLGISAGLSLGLLAASLSAMYMRGVTMEPAIDQALHGAVLLPLVCYACLVGSGWRWLAGTTLAALGLEILLYITNASAGDPLLARLGPMILAYGIIYTLAAAIVAVLVTNAHHHVLAIAAAEAATARRHAIEQQLAESRVRAILDSVQNPIYAKDAAWRFVDCNAAFCKALGWRRDEVIGRTIAEIAPVDEGRVCFARDTELFACGGSQAYEASATWADGSPHPVMVYKALVTAADGSPAGMVGSLVDLSDQRQLQERLLQAEKLEAIGRLAGGVAHDINNQLAGILGYAELLGARLPAGADRDDALAIAVAARRAADLPRRLLAFARKGDYLTTPVDIHRLIDEVCSLLTRSIDPGIHIERRLDALRPMVVGDPGQLQSLLLNLGLNARDAMPQGGRLTFITTDQMDPTDAGCDGTRLPAGAYIRIAVVDTGTGMDETVRRRLFEPFFTTKGSGKGTGLGLASVYGAVRIHHGGIAVASEPGRGSTFAVTLPASPAHPAKPRCRTPLPAEHASERSLRILVVDDEPIVRAVVAAQLQRLGHLPLVHESGESALGALRAGDGIDAALIDLMMPGMDGQTLFHHLRGMHPDLPIAIASGHHDDHVAQELLDAGAAAFVAKPHGLDELARVFGRPGAAPPR